MFVCGGSFLVKAQSSAEAVTAPTEINATVVNDTVVKDTVTKEDAPAKASLSCTRPPMSMIQLSQTLHQKTNRLSLSRNNLANNMQDIVCRRIVSTLKKSHPYFRLFRGWLFIILSSYNHSVGVLVSNIGSVFQLETIFAASASKLFPAKDTNVLVLPFPLLNNQLATIPSLSSLNNLPLCSEIC